MSEIKKETFEIKEADKEFFQEFLGISNTIVVDSFEHKKLVSALDKAHDIRKFEIDLYWKRATYFFAFFTVVTAAFGFSFSNYRFSYLSPALAIIGFVFATCFYYVNIGSKYWQENWEFLIDKIEFYVTGNLYKVFFFEDQKDKRPSVSKINLFLSAFIILVWIACFITSVLSVFSSNKVLFFIYIIAMIYAIGTALYFCDKSVKDTSKADNEKLRKFKFRKPKYKKE